MLKIYMGEYANIKRKKLKNFLKWLANKKYINIKKGGKHQIIIEYSFWERPFPIPFKHNEINRHIIKDLCDKLTSSDICSKEEFDKKIK